MGQLTYAQVSTRQANMLALTSLTVDDFQALVKPFGTAFQVTRRNGRWKVSGGKIDATPRIRIVRITTTMSITPL